VHKTSIQRFYDFFRDADSVRVVSSSSGSWQSQATKYISCIFEAKFFTNGAIKSVTLLAHAAFGSVYSSEIKNSVAVSKLIGAPPAAAANDDILPRRAGV